ncbi:sensor histidine kinase [Oerskovia merdavium]|uniref:histidine kinase n=1 Tax=Oerskovia merdavium TaxID=2762227 RepID=A0ABR8U336_9CELL|nr:histidine kinase [Oerskovia merdavium]MBD7982189.1 two-component sensor histidine kinase [Oerskovia merdavium]
MVEERTNEPEDGQAPVFTELSARRLGPVRRFFVRRPAVMDVLVLLGFAAWALLMGVGADSMYVLHAYLGGEKVAAMQWASFGLTLVGTVALWWRRRSPLLVAAVMTVLGVAALATTGLAWGFDVGVTLALYAVATERRPLVTWTAFAGAVAALLVGALAFPLPARVGAITLGLGAAGSVEADTLSARATGFLQSAVWYQTAVPVLVLGLLAVAAGTSVRNRRLHVAAFVEAANALARDQEQRTRLAQAGERARIAREMHDVVAHSISVMVALGGGASAAIDWAPDRARTALGELVATGRSALGDMRRVLGVLHEGVGADEREGLGAGKVAGDGAVGDTRPARPGPVPTGHDALFDPQPGGIELAALVERFRTAGIPVRTQGLATDGLTDLDPSLQLAVYRIVQEALTNALRHAPGTPGVEVEIHRDAGGVEVVVMDGGTTLPVEASPGSQRGLVGMRERAAVFGGVVEAGRYGRGWRVRALLPWDEGER